jgi:protein O-GlcNAc transferase
MRTYNLMDISLDSWPYAGTTTTCESLFMGVPIVTLRGGCHAQNVGSTLCLAIGHPEFIANTVDEYIEIAVKLGKDPAALSSLRNQIRNDMERSILMDGKKYLEKLEAQFEEMVKHYHTSSAASSSS